MTWSLSSPQHFEGGWCDDGQEHYDEMILQIQGFCPMPTFFCTTIWWLMFEKDELRVGLRLLKQWGRWGNDESLMIDVYLGVLPEGLTTSTLLLHTSTELQLLSQFMSFSLKAAHPEKDKRPCVIQARRLRHMCLTQKHASLLCALSFNVCCYF